MKKFTILSLVCIPYAFANQSLPLEKDNVLQHQAEPSDAAIQQGLLRQERLKADKNVDKTEVEKNLKQQAALDNLKQDLLKNPNLLEKLFLESLILADLRLLPLFIEIYPKVEKYDPSLIEWGEVLLQRNNDLTGAIQNYRKLVEIFPDNYFLRYQLAETLFYNQDIKAAQKEFEQLKSSYALDKENVQLINKYLEMIDKKYSWNFSFGGTFLNDPNLANSAKQGQKMILANGAEITYDTPRQKGQGFSAWLGANKRWGLANGKYVLFNSGLSNKYYWNNKKFNELNSNISLGLGYENAKFSTEFTPYASRRWYSGGVNGSDALKRYSDTYGVGLSANYWLTAKLKYSFHYNYGYDFYRGENKNIYNGANHFVSNSLLYFAKPTQYFSLGADFSTKNAAKDINSYNRIGARLGWGQEWPLHFSSNVSLGVAKRSYKEGNFLGKQENKEYSLSFSLLNRKINYLGFMPKLSMSYMKVNSNIPIYTYDKYNMMLEVERAF